MFELWDINVGSFDLFLAAASQWRVVSAGLGGLVWLGLDYVGVDVLMKRTPIDDADGQLWADLMVMEDAALEAFGETQR